MQRQTQYRQMRSHIASYLELRSSAGAAQRVATINSKTITIRVIEFILNSHIYRANPWSNDD